MLGMLGLRATLGRSQHKPLRPPYPTAKQAGL
jgi:hypothetical protein